MGKILAGAVVVAALLAVSLVVRSENRPHAALDFTVDDMNGEKVNLTKFAGKPLVINLWATWCVPCEIETPQLVELGNKYRARGLQIVGVSVDDKPEQIREFASRLKVDYPMLVGLGQDAFLTSLGYDGNLPRSVFVSANGTIVETILGIRKTEDWERIIEKTLR